MLQLTDSPLGPVDLTPDAILKYIDAKVGLNNTKYAPVYLQHIADELVHWTGVFGWRTSWITAQILHETDYFRFTGDVSPNQYNFAGLGTTGGGVKGATIGKDSDTVSMRMSLGIIAVCAHHAVYVFGTVDRWPDALQGLVAYDPRYQAVIDAGLNGAIKKLGDYGGKWAADVGYSGRVLIKANELLTYMEGIKLIRPKIFLTAGHHNTSGGNPVEYAITGELTEEIARAFNFQGAEVRVGTPDGPDADTDPGDGNFPGTLSDAARQVVTFSGQGWVADIFGEIHTEGAGGPRGCFGIYPDWAVDNGNDVDTDARDKLIPGITRRIANNTGLSVRNGGLMSEKATGVGGQGFRLGIFGATASIRNTTTRLIIEHGAHDTADLGIIHNPTFNKNVAMAWVEATFEFLNVQLPKTWHDYFAAAPTPVPVSNTRHFKETGFDITAGFKGFWETLEGLPFKGVPLSFLVLGYPVENEHGFTDPNGKPGSLQRFERGWLIWNSQEPSPWDVTLVQLGQATKLGLSL